MTVVKKLSLSLVITTIITTNLFALNTDSLFDEVDGSQVHSVLNAKQDVIDERLAQVKKATEQKNLTVQKDFFKDLVEKSQIAQNIFEEDEVCSDASFVEDNTPEIDVFNEQVDAEFLAQARKAQQDAWYHAEAQRIADEANARWVHSNQPSRFQIAGEYVVSGTKALVKKGLWLGDYAARSLPVACYVCSQYGDEIVSYTAYAAARVLGTVSFGPQIGEQVGNVVYKGTKVALRTLPGATATFVLFAAPAVSFAVNTTLDVAPYVVNGAVSGTKATVAAVSTAVEKVTSVASTVASYASSAAGKVTSFFWK